MRNDVCSRSRMKSQCTHDEMHSGGDSYRSPSIKDNAF